MKTYQKAAALAVVQSLLAACGGGGTSSTDKAPASAPPASAPASAPAPSSSSSSSSSSPSITAQPADSSVLTGATATFTVTATGTAPAYQWKKNGSDISGATSASYTTPAATWQDDGAVYTVVVSNASGSATSTAATLHLKLSDDQATSESFLLAPASGSYSAEWYLNYVGGQTSGNNYLEYDYAVLAKSPLTNGPQTDVQQAPANITKSLAMQVGSTSRILKNGVVLVVPDFQGSYVLSYVGSAIQVDYLASDNQTVAFSRMRYGFASLPLSGPLHSAPSELTNPYNSIFGNPGVMDTTTTWAQGSAYLRFSQSALGDRYKVFDCPPYAATTGNTPSPCLVNTTLATAMSMGQTMDGTTYHTADGKISTIGGVDIWVATQARPTTSVGAYTVEYRIFFELNGNVYTGSLIKDGTVESTYHYRTNPSSSASTKYLDYNVRLNGAAMHSLVAGSLL